MLYPEENHSKTLVERYKKKNIRRFKIVDFLENKNVKS
jgi:hypothetical protein